MISRIGKVITFQRSGAHIETISTQFSGRVSVHDFSGEFQLWRVRPGMVFSGQGRPFQPTPSRLLLVRVKGKSATVVDEAEPGRFWRKKRQELSDKMRTLSRVECEVCGAPGGNHVSAIHKEYNATWCSK